MKKIFYKVAMMATILAGGFSMTSCGSDDVLNTISSALTIWQQINAGETLYFSGTSKVRTCTLNSTSGQFTYNAGTDEAAYSAHGLNMVVKSNQASIAIGDFTVGGYSVSNLDLTSVSYSSGTIGDANMEYVYNCSFSLTKDGKTTSYSSPATITDGNSTPYAYATGTVTNEGALKLTIYILVTPSHKLEIEYSGNKTTAN